MCTLHSYSRWIWSLIPTAISCCICESIHLSVPICLSFFIFVFHFASGCQAHTGQYCPRSGWVYTSRGRWPGLHHGRPQAPAPPLRSARACRTAATRCKIVRKRKFKCLALRQKALRQILSIPSSSAAWPNCFCFVLSVHAIGQYIGHGQYICNFDTYVCCTSPTPQFLRHSKSYSRLSCSASIGGNGSVCPTRLPSCRVPQAGHPTSLPTTPDDQRKATAEWLSLSAVPTCTCCQNWTDPLEEGEGIFCKGKKAFIVLQSFTASPCGARQNQLQIPSRHL